MLGTIGDIPLQKVSNVFFRLIGTIGCVFHRLSCINFFVLMKTVSTVFIDNKIPVSSVVIFIAYRAKINTITAKSSAQF